MGGPGARRGAWSLRRSLLAILLALTVSVWLCSAGLIYLEADHESDELFDQALVQTAHLLLTLADRAVDERGAIERRGAGADAPLALDASVSSPATLDEPDIETHAHLLFQIWDARGRLLYRNRDAPDAPFVPLDTAGYGGTRLRGEPWRVYSAWNGKHRLHIQVAQPHSNRKEISNRFAYKLLLFAIIVIPLMASAIWWFINRVFRAVRDCADEVSRRTPNDLRQVDLHGAPDELHALLNAINHLFDRVGKAWEREQRFTADASHELRTPLAAIKTNLQVIERARNDAERDEAAAGLAVSVERASRLVGQLMTLSRLDPQYARDPALRELDLAAVLRTQLEDLARQARKHGVALATRLAPASCRANPDSLLILLRNLADNAIRYAPPGGRVELSCGMDRGAAWLRVADSGAGIAPAMRERVFERFFRLPGTHASGSGLGLSIVKNIADTHQAGILLDDGLDGVGLCVEIRFPPVPATA